MLCTDDTFASCAASHRSSYNASGGASVSESENNGIGGNSVKRRSADGKRTDNNGHKKDNCRGM